MLWFFRNSAQFFHAFFTIRSHFFQRYFRFVRYAESTKTKNPHAPQGCAERRLSICPKYSTMTLHQNPISSHPIPIRTALSSQLPHSRSRPLRHPSRRKKGGKAGKIVALLLACALVGGGSGFGAAALMQKRSGPAAEHNAGILRCVRHARGQAAGSGSAGRIR